EISTFSQAISGQLKSGAGTMNLSAALSATTAVSPVSVSLGELRGTGTVKTLTVTNLAKDTVNLTLSFATKDTLRPRLSSTALTLGANQSQNVSVDWPTAGAPPGPYQGFIEIAGGAGGTVRVPYWAAIRGTPVSSVSLLSSPSSGRPGALVSVVFRTVDAAGLSLRDSNPDVSVVSGGGSLNNILPADSFYPGIFVARVRLGAVAGTNIFKITTGNLSREVRITGSR
ncbi:MAG: hypothetical protein HYZ37_14795, partial [Candidatus Solibacter usitatus]|nr:hypothetical protein [Candidatus Solibacter usitatus]